MLKTLRNSTFRHLFAAQIVALLGTGLATVALGLLAFAMTGCTTVAPGEATPVPQVMFFEDAERFSALMADDGLPDADLELTGWFLAGGIKF